MFPFTTRRNFLYCTAFGRDRALMHLVNEANPDDHDNESNSRLVPRLERRKISINRATLLKDAQHAMNQLASSRFVLTLPFFCSSNSSGRCWKSLSMERWALDLGPRWSSTRRSAARFKSTRCGCGTGRRSCTKKVRPRVSEHN